MLSRESVQVSTITAVKQCYERRQLSLKASSTLNIWLLKQEKQAVVCFAALFSKQEVHSDKVKHVYSQTAPETCACTLEKAYTPTLTSLKKQLQQLFEIDAVLVELSQSSEEM